MLLLYETVDIMLGHHFYNWTRDPNQSLMPEHIEKFNTKFLFLGHDHEPHEPETIGNTMILRPGSVLRTELKAYTMQHKPHYYTLFQRDSQIQLQENQIPHENAQSVFRIQEKQDLKHCAKLMTEIKNLLDSTDIATGNQKSIREILTTELNAPQDVLEYLSLIYKVNRMEF